MMMRSKTFWTKCSSRGGIDCCVHVKQGLKPGVEPIKSLFCCWCNKSQAFPFPAGMILPKPADLGAAHGRFAAHHLPAVPEDLTYVP
jgi:hypothetical protein